MKSIDYKIKSHQVDNHYSITLYLDHKATETEVRLIAMDLLGKNWPDFRVQKVEYAYEVGDQYLWDVIITHSYTVF